MVNFAELDHAAAEAAGRLAEEGARLAHDAGVAADPVAVKASGPVWQTIIEFADRHRASAIVMGSRGLNVLSSILLGSVSRGVAHHATRPTIVIHPSEEESRSADKATVAQPGRERSR
jgi:nucleotide-binding universal stress UspA family protein